MVIFLALVALCLSGSALANGPLNSSCPAVTGQSNFYVDKYMGTWYMNFFYFDERPSVKFILCNYGVYSRDESGAILLVSHSQFEADKPRTMKGIVRIPNEKDAPTIKVHPFEYPSFESDIYVLSTDYETYAILYNCEVHAGIASRHVGIATRAKHPSVEVVDKAAAELEKHGINISTVTRIDQIDC